MAHSLQAKKRIRQTERTSAVNRARVGRIRTFIRAVEEAVTSGDKARAEAALKAAQPEIMRGVTRGVMHANTASRRISRMARRIKKLA